MALVGTLRLPAITLAWLWRQPKWSRRLLDHIGGISLILLGQFAPPLVGALAVALIFFVLTSRAEHSYVLNRRWADTLVMLFTLAYVLVFGTLSLLRHESLHSWYDLAVYDQTIYNSLNGRLLYDTIQFDNPNFLGFHFSPILLAWVPLYAIWSDARMLLVSQTILLAFTALPLYWYARKAIGNGLAVVLVLALFLSPALEYINLYDFHEIALAAPILSLATFFLLRRRHGPFLVCAALLLLIKEETAIIIATFGLYLVFVQHRRVLGTSLVLGGIGALIGLVSIVIPSFSSQNYLIAGAIYGSLGNSVTDIVRTIATRPDKVWEIVWTVDKARFVLQLFVPLAFVSLLGLEVTALSFPTFAYLLIADAGPRTDIRFHYTSTLLPFLFFGCVVGLNRLLTWKALHIPTARGVCTLAALIAVAVALSYQGNAPGPLATGFDPSTYVMDARARDGRSLIAMVPANAIVVTQKEHLSQFSDRQGIYDFPSIPDYRQTEYLFAEVGRFWYNFHIESWKAWFATGYFEVIAQKGNFVLARRRPPEHSAQVHFGSNILLDGYRVLPSDSLRGGMVLTPMTFWRATGPISARYNAYLQVLDQQGHLWATAIGENDGGGTPTTAWQVDRTVGDQHSLSLPVTMPPGEYSITVGMHSVDDGDALPAYDGSLKPLGTEPVLAKIRVEKNTNSITASQLLDKFQLDQPLFVDMADVRLIGFTSLPQQAHDNALLPVGLYWRAREKPSGDYIVRVRLFDSTGRVVVEQSDRPAAGAYPTTQWVRGEVLLDWHDLFLPSSVQPGAYTVQVLLADAVNGTSLAETAIGTVTVSAP